MPGPPPKPEARRQRRNRPTQLAPIESGPRTIPNAPADLEPAAITAWDTLWRSPLAATFLDSDRPALLRLFQLIDERSRAFRVARRRRTVDGSKGQPVLNPLLGYVASLDPEIRALEDRFGLTPRARLALGIALGEAHRSLDALNVEFLREVS